MQRVHTRLMAFQPAYLRLYQTGELFERVDQARALLAECRVCPRECRVDRTAGALGKCRVGAAPMVSAHHAHSGEEPPLVGVYGSGTIFFTGCNLACVYCQNYDISHHRVGEVVSTEALAAMMVALQNRGCHNVNLVTPTHQMPQILAALPLAIERGLMVPLVYNCGGYESLHSLHLLDDVVDIYMPDLKYADPEVGRELSGVADYPQRAQAAVAEMHRQVGDLVIDRRGIAQRGLIVRHLVLPAGLAGTAAVARFLSQEISPGTYLNLMDQYHPCFMAFDHPLLGRRPTEREFADAVRTVREAGLNRVAGIPA
jgi:putative pyruvate formate lyase activating enzyme